MLESRGTAENGPRRIPGQPSAVPAGLGRLFKPTQDYRPGLSSAVPAGLGLEMEFSHTLQGPHQWCQFSTVHPKSCADGEHALRSKCRRHLVLLRSPDAQRVRFVTPRLHRCGYFCDQPIRLFQRKCIHPVSSAGNLHIARSLCFINRQRQVVPLYRGIDVIRRREPNPPDPRQRTRGSAGDHPYCGSRY
jgi:hypothetical protein